MIVHAKFDAPISAPQRIGREVLHARKRLGLRQDELALAADVSTRVIHQIEHGKATSRLDSLTSVLDALGLTLEVRDKQ